MDKLTKKQKGFVKDYIETGNATEAAERNYDVKNRNVANNIGAENLAKPSVRGVIISLAERISDDKLEEVLNEGLGAYKTTRIGGEEGADNVEPDFAVRHKYLDTALKLKGLYESDEQKNINVLMPVLVKFLDNKDDRSDHRDTQ